MNSVMRFATCVAAVAGAVLFAAGCNDSGSSDTTTPSTFSGASDSLDGHFIGQVTSGGKSAGLVMKVDQNKYLVYGPIEIGSLAGNFKGSFSGNDISFQATVTGTLHTATYKFNGLIGDGGDLLSGSFNAVVDGAAESGTWFANR
jgi:hypothetical protein